MQLIQKGWNLKELKRQRSSVTESLFFKFHFSNTISHKACNGSDNDNDTAELWLSCVNDTAKFWLSGAIDTAEPRLSHIIEDLKLKYLFKFAIVFRKYCRAWISGLSGDVWWKNQCSKISWDCPFKAKWMGFRVRCFICFYERSIIFHVLNSASPGFTLFLTMRAYITL